MWSPLTGCLASSFLAFAVCGALAAVACLALIADSDAVAVAIGAILELLARRAPRVGAAR